MRIQKRNTASVQIMVLQMPTTGTIGRVLLHLISKAPEKALLMVDRPVKTMLKQYIIDFFLADDVHGILNLYFRSVEIDPLNALYIFQDIFDDNPFPGAGNLIQQIGEYLVCLHKPALYQMLNIQIKIAGWKCIRQF